MVREARGSYFWCIPMIKGEAFVLEVFGAAKGDRLEDRKGRAVLSRAFPRDANRQEKARKTL